MKAALVAVALVACSSESDRQPVVHERVPPRHLPEPVGTMHSLPPHPIRSDGIGPYTLGERFEVLYGVAPRFARLEPFDIRGVVRSHVIHAEDETVLIGGEPNGTAYFIAAIDPNVARTESGFHVGSTRDDLIKALGNPLSPIDRTIDPRVVAPASMKNARAILDDDRVIAFALTSDPIVEHGDGESCPRPVTEGTRFGVCFGQPFVVERDGEDLVLRAVASSDKPTADKPTGDKPTPDKSNADKSSDKSGASDKPLAAVHVPGLVYAAALRHPGESRDELVAIARSDDGSTKSWALVSFALDKGKLVKAIDSTLLYTLTSSNARWIGAELHDVDLYIELSSRNDAIEASGLLTTRSNDKLRNVVPLSPFVVPHRHGRPAATDVGGDAGVPDATDHPPDHVPDRTSEPSTTREGTAASGAGSASQGEGSATNPRSKP